MYAERYISAKAAQDNEDKTYHGVDLKVLEVTFLPEEYAIGRVKKTLYYKAEPKKERDLIEMAVLELAPGAEILQHQHVTDMEYYINNVTNEATLCNVGEWHGYKNDTDKPMTLVSIKVAVIV